MSLCVIASSSLPEGFRGAITKWFIEVQPGIFVGNVSARVRDQLWTVLSAWIGEQTASRTGEELSRPYAVLVSGASSEQGFTLRSAGDDTYRIVDYQGLQLVQRQHKRAPAGDLLDVSLLAARLARRARHNHGRVRLPHARC